MPWHRSTADQLKDLLNLWYLSPGNSLASSKDPVTRVPSNYFHQMSRNMIIPSHCIRLMDCVGQGRVYEALLPHSIFFHSSETHTKVEVWFLPITIDYCHSWYFPKAYLTMPTCMPTVKANHIPRCITMKSTKRKNSTTHNCFVSCFNL